MKLNQVKCPRCQSENQRNRKFCRECGGKLQARCPQCDSENQLDDKYCGECGHILSSALPAHSEEPLDADLTWNEKLAKIQRYLPKGLTEKILAQKEKIEGERKQATVMFCDLVGFTSISEKLGHEEVYALIDRIMEILIHQVHAYEGMMPVGQPAFGIVRSEFLD